MNLARRIYPIDIAVKAHSFRLMRSIVSIVRDMNDGHLAVKENGLMSGEKFCHLPSRVHQDYCLYKDQDKDYVPPLRLDHSPQVGTRQGGLAKRQ